MCVPGWKENSDLGRLRGDKKGRKSAGKMHNFLHTVVQVLWLLRYVKIGLPDNGWYAIICFKSSRVTMNGAKDLITLLITLDRWCAANAFLSVFLGHS